MIFLISESNGGEEYFVQARLNSRTPSRPIERANVRLLGSLLREIKKDLKYEYLMRFSDFWKSQAGTMFLFAFRDSKKDEDGDMHFKKM